MMTRHLIVASAFVAGSGAAIWGIGPGVAQASLLMLTATGFGFALLGASSSTKFAGSIGSMKKQRGKERESIAKGISN